MVQIKEEIKEERAGIIAEMRYGAAEQVGAACELYADLSPVRDRMSRPSELTFDVLVILPLSSGLLGYNSRASTAFCLASHGTWSPAQSEIMRLLECTLNPDNDEITIRPTEYGGLETPEYAILSHRWREEEVEYQHMISGSDYTSMRGYKKIEGCARAALRYGISYIWIDTCCINKSSSAELSEAINSMYAWYNDSLMCFAYLDDVIGEGGVVQRNEIRDSTWFTRGWTLQELIAPKTMMFYSKDWVKIGSRMDLANTISAASSIDIKILQNTRLLESASVAEKMSWAARRETTRMEDVAYSLLGLFGVNMPTLYGEGPRAFRRLQLEIMQNSNDHTLFAWDASTCSGDMLASSPKQFSGRNNLQPIPYSEYIARFAIASPKPDYGLTNAGLHIQLPMILNPRSTTGGYVAFLACTRVDPVQRYIAVVYLERTETPSFYGFHRVAFQGATTGEEMNPSFGNYASQVIWVSKKVVYEVRKEYVPSRILTSSDVWGAQECV